MVLSVRFLLNSHAAKASPSITSMKACAPSPFPPPAVPPASMECNATTHAWCWTKTASSSPTTSRACVWGVGCGDRCVWVGGWCVCVGVGRWCVCVCPLGVRCGCGCCAFLSFLCFEVSSPTANSEHVGSVRFPVLVRPRQPVGLVCQHHYLHLQLYHNFHHRWQHQQQQQQQQQQHQPWRLLEGSRAAVGAGSLARTK